MLENDEESFKDKQLREEITRIKDALTDLAPADRGRLSEHIFVGVFLPLFLDEPLLYNVSFKTWIDRAAGSPYKEVDIVDNSGRVLFTVPPLLDRTTVNTITDSRVSITHVIVTANQYGRIHPNQGKAYLDSELAKRATIMHVPANMINHLDIWNAIFKRYNRPEIFVVEETKAQSLAGKSTEEDFELL